MPIMARRRRRLIGAVCCPVISPPWRSKKAVGRELTAVCSSFCSPTLAAFADRRCDRDGLEQRLFLLGRGRRGGAFPDDLEHGIAILGAIVMDLLAKVHDKAACRHRHRGLGIEFGPGTNPPSPRDHRDEPGTIEGMSTTALTG